MKSIYAAALCALALAAASAIAQAPPLTSYRLYKLCDAQDPQCLPLLRGLIAKVIEVNPDCRYSPVSDERLWTVFMQVTSRDLTVLRFSPLLVTTQAYSVMTSCVHQLPPEVAAEIPPRPAADSAARPQPALGHSLAQSRIRHIAGMQRLCSERHMQSTCRSVELETAELTKRGWCLNAEADPGLPESWHTCAAAK